MSQIVSTVPLLKRLRQEGSTFYTLSGAVNDSILLFGNSNVRMNFSKFVCLKLPNWENVAKQRLYHDPTAIESTNDTSSADDPNTFFVKSYLQNYTENFTSYIDDNRTDGTWSNFSEAAFWKSMQQVSDVDNSIDDRYRSIQLVVDSEYDDTALVTREKFKERDAANNDYEPVIQYVGDVNMLNHVKSSGKEYLEVFGHIPTDAGKMTGVLLKYNQGLDASLGQVPASSGPNWVAGQEDNYTNAAGSEKTYASAIYDTADKKYNVNTEKDFLQIDWDDIESDNAKENKWRQGNFDFNAVLLYVDIFDTENPENRKRNLYGVLFLDSFTEVSATLSQIPTFKKYQPNANQAGNAFGFRFNLMFSSSTNQLTSEVSINDFSTVSMDLYLQALQRLQQVSDEYQKASMQMITQSQQMQRLEQSMLSINAFINRAAVPEAPANGKPYARKNKGWEEIT